MNQYNDHIFYVRAHDTLRDIKILLHVAELIMEHTAKDRIRAKRGKE